MENAIDLTFARGGKYTTMAANVKALGYPEVYNNSFTEALTGMPAYISDNGEEVNMSPTEALKTLQEAQILELPDIANSVPLEDLMRQNPKIRTILEQRNNP